MATRSTCQGRLQQKGRYTANEDEEYDMLGTSIRRAREICWDGNELQENLVQGLVPTMRMTYWC